MEIRPIHTEADYKATLKEISVLMDSDPDLGTPEGDRLDILATLVQAYEAKHVPITAPDPVQAIKFRMDQSGLSIKDLEPIIGKSNRVYEVLNRKRPLALAMDPQTAPEPGHPAHSSSDRVSRHRREKADSQETEHAGSILAIVR